MNLTHIKETCIYIENSQRTYDFYSNILGLNCIAHDPGRHVFFKIGETLLLCFVTANSAQKISPPPHYAYGRQHFAFECEAKDFDNNVKDLEFAQVVISEKLTWENGYKSIYFEDPDGNLLEIIQRGFWES